jgi:hypothetical protein
MVMKDLWWKMARNRAEASGECGFTAPRGLPPLALFIHAFYLRLLYCRTDCYVCLSFFEIILQDR